MHLSAYLYFWKTTLFELIFTKIEGTDINELFDKQLFIDCLYSVNKYELIKDSLKLFYGDNQSYLKFRK